MSRQEPLSKASGRLKPNLWEAEVSSIQRLRIPQQNLVEGRLNSTSGIRVRFIDSQIPRLEEEKYMKKLHSETEESVHRDQDHVKEIYGLKERKKNYWTFLAAAAKVYGGRIHESGLSKVLQGCKNLLLCEKGFRLLTSRDSGRLLAQEREVSELSSICSHKECVTATRCV
ncbi:hypothetical protein YC2023_023496 [Brassica napus]